MASTPGITPLTAYGTTLGEILGYDGEAFDPERVSILRMYVLGRVKSLLADDVDSDPIKLFVKQEPHKISKLEEGRLRLISAVSIVDTMVDRMLFQETCEVIISKPMWTPIAIGWTPLKSGVPYFKAHLPGVTFDTDKKHWDWTFPYWLLKDCYHVLVSLSPLSKQKWFQKLAWMRFSCLYEHAVFQFPDGTVVKQWQEGIQKSGCFLTLILNSLGQWLLHEHAQLVLGVKVPLLTFGDDVTQISTEHNEDFVRFYRELGFSVESAVNEVTEFIGFKLLDSSAFVPAYRDKHVFLLQHLTEDEEIASQTLVSYQYLYYFDKPFLAFIRDIARYRGLEAAIVPDRQLARVVYGR